VLTREQPGGGHAAGSMPAAADRCQSIRRPVSDWRSAASVSGRRAARPLSSRATRTTTWSSAARWRPAFRSSSRATAGTCCLWRARRRADPQGPGAARRARGEL